MGNPAALSGSTFDTSGVGSLNFGLNVATFGGLQGSGSLALNNVSSTPVALSVGGNNANTTFSGSLGGSGRLTKIGFGALTLLASNVYTGATQISGGTLQIGNGGSGAAIGGTSSVLDNGNLVFNNANLVGFTPVISGSGNLAQLGPGTLTLSASNGYTGITLISGGTLLLANTAALSGSTFDTSGSGSLSFGTFTNVTLGGLQGSGSLALNNASPAAVSLSVGGNNASTTFSGGLSGSGSLTKLRRHIDV